jgi:hypothetical protein
MNKDITMNSKTPRTDFTGGFRSQPGDADMWRTCFSLVSALHLGCAFVVCHCLFQRCTHAYAMARGGGRGGQGKEKVKEKEKALGHTAGRLLNAYRVVEYRLLDGDATASGRRMCVQKPKG